MIDVRLEGFDDLEKLLNQAAKKAPEATEKVLHNVGEKTRVEMRELSPIDTSFMHDHIVHEPFPLGSQLISEASYSGYVDKGTRYMDAQPFFTDGLDYGMKELERLFPEVIEGVLR